MPSNDKPKTHRTSRDAQLRHIDTSVKKALASGQPVISVDTKKKEIPGNCKNAGQEWRSAKQPRPVQGHDFPGPDAPRAYPYGIHGIGENTGFVNVETDHDTSAFAAASMRGWWKHEDRRLYPKSNELPITADSGGSNGARLWMWKPELQKLANEARHYNQRVPFSSGHKQVEQDRAPAVPLHFLKLGSPRNSRVDSVRSGPCRPGGLPAGRFSPSNRRSREQDLIRPIFLRACLRSRGKIRSPLPRQPPPPWRRSFRF